VNRETQTPPACEQPSATEKVCSDCGRVLPFSLFYQIKAKDEVTPRWDRRCRDCKKRRVTESRKRKRPDAEAKGREQQVPETPSKLSGAVTPSPAPEDLSLSKSDFDNVVRLFSLLKKWRDEDQADTQMGVSNHEF